MRCNTPQQPRGGTQTWHRRSYIGLRPFQIDMGSNHGMQSCGPVVNTASTTVEARNSCILSASSVLVGGSLYGHDTMSCPKGGRFGFNHENVRMARPQADSQRLTAASASSTNSPTFVATVWGIGQQFLRRWALTSMPRLYLEKTTGIRASAHLVVEEPIVGRNRKLQLACHFRPRHGWYKPDPGRGKHTLPSDEKLL